MPPRPRRRRRAAWPLLALLWGLAGCVVSQPIVITYPPGATWTFQYRDALGEELGTGKAEVTFSGEDRLRVTLTEGAFGDTARLEGRLGQGAAGWAPFAARGRWFDGRPFLFVGCLQRAEGRVASGALALHQAHEQALEHHPLRRNPCAGVAARPSGSPRFARTLVDHLFSWSAAVPDAATPR